MWDELVAAAIAVRQQAHAPYSRYRVGAALRCASGRIFVGANVENASFGLTQCAERSAVTAAVSAGEREFTALVIATADGGWPCGACRQVLAEFCAALPIVIVAADDPALPRLDCNLRELLPGRFTLE